MNWIRPTYRVVATVVRPVSATAFAAEVISLVATCGEPGWASWRRLDLGWRFWMGLGNSCAILAFCCLPLCFFLGHLRSYCEDEPSKKIGWCVLLNLGTVMVATLLMPAIAAI